MTFVIKSFIKAFIEVLKNNIKLIEVGGTLRKVVERFSKDIGKTHYNCENCEHFANYHLNLAGNAIIYIL
jgi:hypothetical protein